MGNYVNPQSSEYILECALDQWTTLASLLRDNVRRY